MNNLETQTHNSCKQSTLSKELQNIRYYAHKLDLTERNLASRRILEDMVPEIAYRQTVRQVGSPLDSSWIAVAISV